MSLPDLTRLWSRPKGTSFGSASAGVATLYVTLIIVITIKILWGFWARDLTFGDTSSYFKDAVRWHQSGQINIVWSPLYTAYFGSWLSVTENASVATFLHRVGLILASTGLVAWLAYVSLPRVLALLLVVWWVALPIHYDTLYEVHLFGALPILLMAVVCMLANEKWKGPLLLSIAIITTFLIRNEYILLIGVFVLFLGWECLRKRSATSISEIKSAGLRYATMFSLAGILVAYFYSASYIQGAAISKVSAPKHTLNMCQVYAFGYQQRHDDWKGSPWTDCSSLMSQKFGNPMPTLREMIFSNPAEVTKHFLWNLSLTRAGLEVLLFNTTSDHDNPDYAPVSITPIIPSVLLGLSILVCLGGAVQVFRKKHDEHAAIRIKLMNMSPLLLAVLMMSIAVILTQRPRPSYLLGLGVLYVWVVLIMLSALIPKCRKVDSLWLMCGVAAGLFLLLPSYHVLSLPSKNGTLGDIYNQLQPQAQKLCQIDGALALNEYGVNIVDYLCSPYNSSPRRGGSGVVEIGLLPETARETPQSLIDALDKAGAKALIIDPYMPQKFPGLGGCQQMQNALLKQGWQELTYAIRDDGKCIGAYRK